MPVAARLALVAMLGCNCAAAQDDRDEVADEAHRVDVATYLGWQTFQRHCATCHGADGEGSRFAPELGPRIGRLTRDAFLALLEDGYPGGMRDGLEPWARNQDVRQYADAIWDYLEARANGALPPGPLEPLAGTETDFLVPRSRRR